MPLNQGLRGAWHIDVHRIMCPEGPGAALNLGSASTTSFMILQIYMNQAAWRVGLSITTVILHTKCVSDYVYLILRAGLLSQTTTSSDIGPRVPPRKRLDGSCRQNAVYIQHSAGPEGSEVAHPGAAGGMGESCW